LVSGSFTLSGLTTSQVVTFTPTQPNTNYRFMLQAKDFTGTPPTDALVIKKKIYTINDVTVTIAGAPGVGNSVTWEWQLIRNT
jgi:hypothetical protein